MPGKSRKNEVQEQQKQTEDYEVTNENREVEGEFCLLLVKI